MKLVEGCKAIAEALNDSWLILSTDKFGSNVVEKIIESGNFLFLAQLLESEANIMSLALSRFGVFVLQKFLECSPFTLRLMVSCNIMALLDPPFHVVIPKN